MSYNGSGVFVINSSGQPVSANTLIEASVFNAFTADVATGLSTAITKDGQSTVTANLPMAGFKFTGLGAGSAAGNSLRYEQLFSTSAVTLLGTMNWVKGADIASDTTINLTTATGNAVHVTGTTAITTVTLGSGMWRMVIFDGALTLTHSATTNNLPGGANITTAANDRALYWSDGTVVYCAAYNKASGKATVAPAVGDVTGLGTGVATALAINVGSAGAFVTSALPAGTIIDFAGATAQIPIGYIACNGAAVSRTVTYADLFSAIGTLWGVGDGSTTFNVPNFAAFDAAVQNNGTVGASTDGVMPAHTHTNGFTATGSNRNDGAGSSVDQGQTNTGSAGSGTRNFAAGKCVLKLIKY